jgi:hypothetical protein
MIPSGGDAPPLHHARTVQTLPATALQSLGDPLNAPDALPATQDADGGDLGRVQFSAALMHQRGTPAARMHALRALCQREARTLRLHQRGFCWSVSADLGLPLCAAESRVWWMANVRFWLVLRLASFVADGAQAVAGHAPCEIKVETLAWPLESASLTLCNRKRKVEHASQGTRLVRFDNS